MEEEFSFFRIILKSNLERSVAKNLLNNKANRITSKTRRYSFIEFWPISMLSQSDFRKKFMFICDATLQAKFIKKEKPIQVPYLLQVIPDSENI